MPVPCDLFIPDGKWDVALRPSKDARCAFDHFSNHCMLLVVWLPPEDSNLATLTDAIGLTGRDLHLASPAGNVSH